MSREDIYRRCGTCSARLLDNAPLVAARAEAPQGETCTECDGDGEIDTTEVFANGEAEELTIPCPKCQPAAQLETAHVATAETRVGARHAVPREDLERIDAQVRAGIMPPGSLVAAGWITKNGVESAAQPETGDEARVREIVDRWFPVMLTGDARDLCGVAMHGAVREALRAGRTAENEALAAIIKDRMGRCARGGCMACIEGRALLELLAARRGGGR